jgi:hypothetical protein
MRSQNRALHEVMSFNKQHFWIDRKDKRVTVNLPCTVSCPGGRTNVVTILNLSAGGMKFACDRSTFEQLLPEGLRTPGMVNDVMVEVVFSPGDPAAENPSPVETSALIIHSERLAQDSYHVGIQFTDLRETDSMRLRAYIEANLGADQAD